MDSLLPYISFQSTLGDLKKPPQSYLLPGVDLVGGMVAIREKLRKGQYKNQYEFVLDIDRLVRCFIFVTACHTDGPKMLTHEEQYVASGDSHFTYDPALLGVFSFQRSLNLTSVSSDGLALPKIYDINDIATLGLSDQISEIEKIDGVPVQEFLRNAAAQVKTQDPDAQFNQLFWSIPTALNGETPSLMAGNTMPDAHLVTFANGTEKRYDNKASINHPFTDIDSGEALHSAVEIPPPATATEAAKSRRNDDGTPTEEQPQTEASQTPSSSEAATTPSSPAGYPVPVTLHPHGYMAGYFIQNSPEHADTAILSITSFIPSDESLLTSSVNELRTTRQTIRSFFKACADAGRTKLIIDVSNNGGGMLFQGYDVYRSLFPESRGWSGSRLRAHAAMEYLGVGYGQPSVEKAITSGIFVNPKDGKRYPTWKDFFGPVKVGEDMATSLLVYDFANETQIAEDGNGSFIINGYDPKDPAPKQPFAKEDIVVLTDGKCHSTCTILVGLLQREAGVRTVAVGGRPLEAPMQAVGGVKGNEVKKLSELQEMWNEYVVPNTGKPESLLSIPKELEPGLPTAGSPPLMPVDLSKMQINFRNSHPENMADGVPAHFMYEAANCRRFYKAEYLTDMTAMWKDVADVAWKGAKCAPGSTVSPDGDMGPKAPEYSDAVRSKVLYDGPGSLTNSDWIALATNRTGTTEGIWAGATSGASVNRGNVVMTAVAAVLGLVLAL